MKTVGTHPETFEPICCTCNEAKVRERFERYLSGNLRAECRSCVAAKRQDAKREWNRQYRAADPDVARRADRVRYQANRETILERSRRYHAEHRETRNAQAKA